ncbi:MAG: succinate dehydrogenase cytochrome b subunit [Bacteroidota bacterium]|nr:succinate dehydrogenase cytochrome b subunit [Bacteroidota bacterium]
MNWFTKAFTSSLGRKWVMSLSGLFMCLFLVVHLAGNFQLFKDDGGLAFNSYTVFMIHNPIIKTISYLLYAAILIHIIQSLVLTIQNRKARPQDYTYNKPEKSSTWSSRNMGILGTVLLVFLVIHFADFWGEYKFGEVPYKNYYEVKHEGESHVFDTKDSAAAYRKKFDVNTAFIDLLKVQGVDLELAQKNPAMMQKLETQYMVFAAKYVGPTEIETEIVKDLYVEVKLAFQQPWYVIFYLIALLALSYHLVHGFQSAWQSIGVHHRKYVPVIKAIGWIFSVVIPAGFAAMPIYFLLDYVNHEGIMDWTRFF